MVILALETSGMHGSVALLREEQVLLQLMLPEDQRSAQSLLVAVKELFQQCQVSGSEVDLIAVTHGPGSFTGLRVGLTAAKALAYAWQCEVVGVDTLASIAAQAATEFSTVPPENCIRPVLDAQRKQLFAASFRIDEGQCVADCPSAVVSREAWLAELRPGDIVAGSGLKPLLGQLPTDVRLAAETSWQPLAATVGQLGFQLAKASDTPCTWQNLNPHYLRGSAAEENPKFHTRRES